MSSLSSLFRSSSLSSSRRFFASSRRRATKNDSEKKKKKKTNAKSEEEDDDAQKRKNPDLYRAGGFEERWEKEEEETEAQRKRRQSARKKPDVLAPAGGWPQLEAAVRNGANCVYFGLELLNARARANNFTIEELPRVMKYLRERGVKGYVTMNVLIFDDEMSECERLIRACAKNGVDAMIVQDVGAARLVKRVAPNMAVHGSTQMSITDANGALFAKEIGCERVVVGRELSISEIKTVVERSPETTVEAFTHGALCVSYSGQCFSSEAWGGRSANRGQCAQACRMPYGFVVNGEIKAMGDEKYLLSPQDLMAVDLVPQLIDAGVSCFKIEGRLKGEEYVGLTTAAYRRAVDLAWENRNVSKKELLTDESRLELRQVFARAQDEHFDGLTTGFLEGTRHQTIVRGRNPRHRGVFAGRVVEVDAKNERVTIQTSSSSVSTNNDGNDDNSSIGGVLKRGFGVVFDDGTPELDEQGGFIYEIFDERGSYVDSSELCSSDFVTLAFARNSIDYRKIRPGNIVWRTSTTSGEKKEQHRKKEKSEEVLAKTSSSASMSADGRENVVCIVSGALGMPLKIALYDTLGNVGEAMTSVHISEAEKRPIDFQSIAKAIGELGGTPFFLDAGENIDCTKLFSAKDGDAKNNIFVPAGEIKKARRDAVEMLLEKRRNMGAVKAEAMASDDVSVSDEMYKSEIEKWWGVPTESNVPKRKKNDPTTKPPSPDETKLTVLCRTMEQVETCCAFDFLDEIQADFLEVHGLRDAVKKIQEAGKKAVVATPRVLKPDEEKLWRFYLSLNADSLLVRSAGLLRKLNELISEHPEEGKTYPRLRGDFSLNAANILTTSTFLDAFNLERLALTHDLNARQIRNLAAALPPETASSKIEIILHCHLPIFHTEHCVFCRFLSDGNSYKDCGHPCETNDARLRDSNGKDHLVLADMGCRNTVFNAEAQSGAMFVQDWINIGNIKNYRIELVDTDKNETVLLLNTYNKLLRGEISSRDAYDALRKVKDKNGNVQGCNVGSFAVREEKSREGMKKTAAEIKLKKKKKSKDSKPSSSVLR